MKQLFRKMRFTSMAQFYDDAVALFGEDKNKWRFVCPNCGHVASIGEYIKAGAPGKAVGCSCIGKWLPAPDDGMVRSGKPCTFEGKGLMSLNPVVIDKTGVYFELDGYETLHREES